MAEPAGTDSRFFSFPSLRTRLEQWKAVVFDDYDWYLKVCEKFIEIKKFKKITEFNNSTCLTIMAGSVVNTVTEKFLKLEWHKNEQWNHL